jgi:hypothetical protein
VRARGVALYMAVLLLMAGAALLVAGPAVAGIGVSQAHAPRWELVAFPGGGAVALLVSALLFLHFGPRGAPPRMIEPGWSPGLHCSGCGALPSEQHREECPCRQICE